LSGAHVGTGFTDRVLCDLRLRLDDLARPLPENVDAGRLVEPAIAVADKRRKTTRDVRDEVCGNCRVELARRAEKFCTIVAEIGVTRVVISSIHGRPTMKGTRR